MKIIDLPFEISENKQNEINNLTFIELGKATNIIGQKFGHLFVLGRAPQKGKLSSWWCICDCKDHNIKQVDGGDLKRGRTKSCGCFCKETSSLMGQNNKKDYSGEIYGDFVVKYPTEHHSGGNIKWIIQCSKCGFQKESAIGHLRRGYGNTCYICNKGKVKSLGEQKIGQILFQHNINFISQHSFKSCIFPDSKKRAMFDFYLPDYNILIEYDGEQHFKSRQSSWEKLEDVQKRDNYKNLWCKENCIPLIRIPYTDFNIIDWEYIDKRIKEVMYE